MKYNIVNEENLSILQIESSGVDLPRALLSVNKESSLIMEVDYLDFNQKLEELVKQKALSLANTNALLVVIGSLELKSKIEKWNNEKAIYLPTLHEAKEAIFMNDLENQLNSELGGSI